MKKRLMSVFINDDCDAVTSEEPSVYDALHLPGHSPKSMKSRKRDRLRGIKR